MVMVFFSPLRRWWQMNFGPGAELSFAAAGAGFDALQMKVPLRPTGRIRPIHPIRPMARVAPSVTRTVAARPLTTASVPAASPARPAARRFWMTLDPQDLRHAALGGSFAEVCAVLEQLAAVEEHRA